MKTSLNISNSLDKNAFESLFRDYFKPLTGFAMKFTGDLDSAKEIVHDVFVKLWDKRAEIDPEKAVKSYLYTSVNNRCLNFIRDNKKFDRNEFALEKNTEQSFSSDESIETVEMRRVIEKSLESLPEKCREVFLMSRNEGLKYQEIADKLNISIKTVETHISKALKILRVDLAEYLTVALFLLIKYF